MITNDERLEEYTRMIPLLEPGDLAVLYDELPRDWKELCEVIGCQLIHPNRVKKIRHALISHTKNEDTAYSSVKDMLEQLLVRNANGLIRERAPHERLIVSCRYHAILLISVLRHRGIPARCRVGFARYLGEAHRKYVDHWVAEVWLEQEQRWILIDPDLQIVDIPADEFFTSGDAWLIVRDGEMNANLFGSKKWWGAYYIRNSVCHDLSSVLGNVLHYWDFPPICQKEMNRLTEEDLQLLDEVSIYLQDPDLYSKELRFIYEDNEQLQFMS